MDVCADVGHRGTWELGVCLFPPTCTTVGLKGTFIHFTDQPRPPFPPQDRAISQEEQVRLSLVTSTMSHLQTFIEHLLCACLVLSTWESTVKEKQGLWL